jgi:hypothetical protein
MASELTNARVFGSIAASLVVHAVIAATLPSEILARTAPVERPVSELEFLVIEPSEPVVVPEPEPEEATPPPEPVRTAAIRPPAEPPRVVEPPSEPVEAPSASVTGSTTTDERPEEPVETPETPITVPGGLRLDPRAVALGAMGSGPRRPVPQDLDGPAVESAEARDERMSEQHSRFLASVGNRRDYISRREPPDLRRRPDGSFTYTGSAFSARILPDGTVQFSDRNNVRFGDFGGPESSLGATVRFDIPDALERRAGNDPYQAERRWFLDETESLRERLGTEHRTTTAVSESRSLRGNLERVWGDAAKPAPRRRASLFRIWDDLAEDETGMPMRRVVLTFIRTRLPQGSPEAYPVDELAALNARRQSAAAFEPY